MKKFINEYYDFMESHKKSYLDIYSYFQMTAPIRHNTCQKFDKVQTVLKRDDLYDAIKALKKEREESLHLLDLK